MSDIPSSANVSPPHNILVDEGAAESLLTHLQELAKTIKTTISSRPLDKLKELNRLIYQHWQSLLWPYLQGNAQKKTLFYTTVYKQILDVLLKYDKIIDQSEVYLSTHHHLNYIVPVPHSVTLSQCDRSVLLSGLQR
jgi:hypothetical protein